MKKNEKIVVIYLIGGLGNKLFQIALAKYLETFNYVVRFDLSASKYFSPKSLRYFQLEHYVQARVLQMTRFFPSPLGKFPNFAKLLRFRFNNTKSDLSSLGFLISDELESSSLIGYWQRLLYTDKLTKDFKELPKKMIAFSNEKYLCIHVRRGDMLNTNDVLNDSYYINAVREVFSYHGFMKIIVVTDDSNYCSTNLGLNYSFEVSSSDNPIDDFKIMVNANILILSRSTFSWWAARLSNAIVYYPSPWNVTQDFDDALIIPNSWYPVKINS